MKHLVVARGREYWMGAVARVLMDEPEDLFTLLQIPVERGVRGLRLPDGPGMRPERAECLLVEEDAERWDGLG